MEKYKRVDIVGIERENERDETYKSTKNPQIDKSRTHLNYHTLPHEKKYLAFIDERIKELAPKRKIKDDAVLITSFILGSDKEFSTGSRPKRKSNALTIARSFSRNATEKKTSRPQSCIWTKARLICISI